MAIFKTIRNCTVGIAVVAGAVAFTYDFLLTPEAKCNLREAVRDLTRSINELNDALQDAHGVVVEDDQPLSNQQDTARQWEYIGY